MHLLQHRRPQQAARRRRDERDRASAGPAHPALTVSRLAHLSVSLLPPLATPASILMYAYAILSSALWDLLCVFSSPSSRPSQVGPDLTLAPSLQRLPYDAHGRRVLWIVVKDWVHPSRRQGACSSWSASTSPGRNAHTADLARATAAQGQPALPPSNRAPHHHRRARQRGGPGPLPRSSVESARPGRSTPRLPQGHGHPARAPTSSLRHRRWIEPHRRVRC